MTEPGDSKVQRSELGLPLLILWAVSPIIIMVLWALIVGPNGDVIIGIVFWESIIILYPWSVVVLKKKTPRLYPHVTAIFLTLIMFFFNVLVVLTLTRDLLQIY